MRTSLTRSQLYRASLYQTEVWAHGEILADFTMIVPALWSFLDCLVHVRACCRISISRHRSPRNFSYISTGRYPWYSAGMCKTATRCVLPTISYAMESCPSPTWPYVANIYYFALFHYLTSIRVRCFSPRENWFAGESRRRIVDTVTLSAPHYVPARRQWVPENRGRYGEVDQGQFSTFAVEIGLCPDRGQSEELLVESDSFIACQKSLGIVVDNTYSVQPEAFCTHLLPGLAALPHVQPHSNPFDMMAPGDNGWLRVLLDSATKEELFRSIYWGRNRRMFNTTMPRIDLLAA